MRKAKHCSCVVLAIILISIYACSTSVQFFQPNIDPGGRAETVAVNPKNENFILVASSSGGLFRSVDGGASWAQDPSIPSYSVTDVAFSPDDPSIVIATVAPALFSNNNGGIWRSTDGGFSWEKPQGANPPPGNRCRKRNGAWSVSFQAGTKHVYVATDCGIAISKDLGNSWSHFALDPKLPVRKDSLQNLQWSIQYAGGKRVWSAGNDGIWYSEDEGGKWQQATPLYLRGRGGSWHAFAPSPFNDNFGFLVASDNRLYQTSDGGKAWIQTGDGGKNGRPPFVRTALSVSNNASEFDLYFGDGIQLHRKTFRQNSTSLTAVGSWKLLNLGHADPCDVSFHSDGKTPYIAASDGGLHEAVNQGDSWKWVGGGAKGYGALQITELAGHFNTSSPNVPNLYFGTQDNDIWASPDGGIKWTDKLCCEGFFLSVPRYTNDPSAAKVTGVACGSCWNFISDPLLKSPKPWNNPPDGDNKNDVDGFPFLIKPGHYYQVAINNDQTPLTRKLMLTTQSGQSWKEIASTPAVLYNFPHMGTQQDLLGSPVIYHCAIRPTFTSEGLKVYGLERIEDIYGSTKVSKADGKGFGSLGIFTTMFAWYPVYAVNPKNPDHLIAADVAHKSMIASHDGGKTWKKDQQLTALLTDNGKYIFNLGVLSLPTNISFDPENPCRILIGTRQNGAFYTIDGGENWEAVSGTRTIHLISSFFFAGNTVYMSSYGRGIYKLNLKKGINGKCSFGEIPFDPGPQAPDTFLLVKVPGGQRALHTDIRDAVCDNCTLAITTEGHLTAIRADDTQLQQVSIVGGSLAHVDQQQALTPMPFEVQIDKSMGDVGSLASIIQPNREYGMIRALVLRGTAIEALIFSPAPISLENAPPASLEVHPAPVGDEPYLNMDFVAAGKPFTIYGSGFRTGPEEMKMIQIYLNDQLYEQIGPDQSGSFVLTLQPDLNIGDYTIRAEQSTSGRFISQEATFRIVVNDRE